jgi:hypothetical protein
MIGLIRSSTRQGGREDSKNSGEFWLLDRLERCENSNLLMILPASKTEIYYECVRAC